MPDFRNGLKYSLLIHASLALLLVHPGCSGKGKGDSDQKPTGKNQGQQEKEKVAPKPENATKETIQVELVDVPVKKKPQPKHANSECPSGQSYGGLGIYETILDGRVYVTDSVKGYPGSDIGLQFGDIIVSPEFDKVKGEVGTEVNLIVRKRDGETKTYTVVRDKICIENTPSP